MHQNPLVFSLRFITHIQVGHTTTLFSFRQGKRLRDILFETIKIQINLISVIEGNARNELLSYARFGLTVYVWN